MQEGLTIGELARESSIPPKTIRYYESIGLIPQATRTFSRYRVYSEKDVRRLELIRRAKLLDLSLSQTGELVQWASSEPCNTFQGHLLEMRVKLDEVDQKSRNLHLSKRWLQIAGAVVVAWSALLLLSNSLANENS